MKDVRVPAANLLGPEGDAFDAISLPMRRTEDAIFAASKAGSIRHILKNICIEAPALAQDKDRLSELGKLAAASSGLSALAFRGAELLDMDSHLPRCWRRPTGILAKLWVLRAVPT